MSFSLQHLYIMLFLRHFNDPKGNVQMVVLSELGSTPKSEQFGTSHTGPNCPAALCLNSCCFWATRTVKGMMARMKRSIIIPTVLWWLGEETKVTAFFIELIIKILSYKALECQERIFTAIGIQGLQALLEIFYSFPSLTHRVF